jgi:hypothetical protein
MEELKNDVMETARIEETRLVMIAKIDENEFEGKITPAHYKITVNGKVFGKTKPIEIKIIEGIEFINIEALEAMLYQKVQINDILLAKVKSNTYYRVSQNSIKPL